MVAIAGTETGAEEKKGTGLYRATVSLLLLQPVLMFIAFFVLSSAINWPASLDEPASVNLPLIVEERGAVVFGYGSYFLYSLLILPLSVALYFALKGREASPLLAVAASFGVISALARVLGIGRWLFLMPLLAETYLDPTSGEATRAAVEVAYAAFNEYAGGVGEIVGVSLTGALWVGLTSIALLRSERFPSWPGLLGLPAAGILMMGLSPIFGVDPGALVTVLGVNVYLVWTVVLAAVLLRSRRSARRMA